MPSGAGHYESGLLNLVILWDVTSNYGLKELVLACPKSGGLDKTSVEAHWYITIPHPALAVEGEPSTQGANDLDITLGDNQNDDKSS